VANLERGGRVGSEEGSGESRRKATSLAELENEEGRIWRRSRVKPSFVLEIL
jgi:hypothetical protein